MMEKYSTDNNTLLVDLQNEEGQLMTKIGYQLSSPALRDDGEITKLEARLRDVRYKIDSILQKKNEG